MQVKQDGFFPADLVFLASTNPDGVCYIEVFPHFIFIFQSFLIFTIIKIQKLPDANHLELLNCLIYAVTGYELIFCHRLQILTEKQI